MARPRVRLPRVRPPRVPVVVAAVAAGACAAVVLALGAASGGASAAPPASLDGIPAEPLDPGERTEPLDQAERAERLRSSGRTPSGGPLRALVLGVAGLVHGPLGPAGGLPATALEAEEPERLYALVTREQAVEPERYAPDDLVPLPGGLYEARAEVAEQLAALIAAAADAGHEHLTVTSGYRDHDTQAGTHEDWVRRVGAERAGTVSAAPGHSEHQLGLAVDLTGACGGFDCFGGSDEGRWVAANAHRFGFLVRYPEGGEKVTGYAYEPWHLRYVGPRAAWAMHLRGEAYWERFAPIALEAATTRP